MSVHGAWAVLAALPATGAVSLPSGYFPLLKAGAEKVEARLRAEPGADLKALEAQPGWRHFPYAILAPAVLYAKPHPQNRWLGDSQMLALAIRIGDLLASEHERGRFEPRLDSDWDTYMWLEAWRLLESRLGQARRTRWKKAIEDNVALLVEDAADRLDFPWYNSPFIGTSPNHYALWATNLLLAGQAFGNRHWEELGRTILRRVAAEEQTPDGYWGEHSREGPTPGYNHLTLSAVGLYWELTRDPAALAALRRATDFHKHFTWPDGTPVEVLNDRNRHWGVSAWSHFAFSHFPDGRRYAEFLTGFFRPDTLTMDQLGRLAQNALYYHEGTTAPIPQEQDRYSYRMQVPGGIRKTGPWVVALSGIISTQAVTSRFYLDRQAHLSVFHTRLGQIITGANSKRQPELATFSERIGDRIFHLPMSSRLQMGDAEDRLSLSYNTFWADLFVPPPEAGQAIFRFVVHGTGRPPEHAQLALQLCLKSGEILETGAGRTLVVGPERIQLDPAHLGGLLRHRGWEMKVDETASLLWPVFPHNPYTDAPETSLEYAVALLSVPLRLESVPGKYVRARQQQIIISVSAP